jgi:CubicO group peptidase (beta-lactamase class C family)
MALPAIDMPAATASQRSRFAAAYQVLEEAVAQQAFPGAAFGVLHQGEVVALDAVGRFTYDPASPAVTPDTVYDLASVSKVIATTSAAMILYDRGLLDLDARLGDILPGFVIGMEPGSHKDQVTVRMLLAHASGLPAYARLFAEYRNPYSLLRACLRMPLQAPPGTRAEYSDIGYILLGVALEVLSGEKLAPFCAREVFAPLGLDHTRFCPPRSQRAAIPPTENDTTFRLRIIQGEVQDENCYALGCATGHAGVFSNCLDLLRYSAAILSGGRSHADHQIFRPATIELFAQRQPSPPGTSRALGWDTPSAPSSSGSHFSPRSIGHLGYAGTSLWIDRERSLAVVLLTNRTWPSRSSEAIKAVRPAFHDALIAALSSAPR